MQPNSGKDKKVSLSQEDVGGRRGGLVPISVHIRTAAIIRTSFLCLCNKACDSECRWFRSGSLNTAFRGMYFWDTSFSLHTQTNESIPVWPHGLRQFPPEENQCHPSPFSYLAEVGASRGWVVFSRVQVADIGKASNSSRKEEVTYRNISFLQPVYILSTGNMEYKHQIRKLWD